MGRRALWLVGAAVLALVLAATWWGWQRGGLALLRLGMGVC